MIENERGEGSTVPTRIVGMDYILLNTHAGDYKLASKDDRILDVPVPEGASPVNWESRRCPVAITGRMLSRLEAAISRHARWDGFDEMKADRPDLHLRVRPGEGDDEERSSVVDYARKHRMVNTDWRLTSLLKPALEALRDRDEVEQWFDQWKGAGIIEGHGLNDDPTRIFDALSEATEAIAAEHDRSTTIEYGMKNLFFIETVINTLSRRDDDQAQEAAEALENAVFVEDAPRRWMVEVMSADFDRQPRPIIDQFKGQTTLPDSPREWPSRPIIDMVNTALNEHCRENGSLYRNLVGSLKGVQIADRESFLREEWPKSLAGPRFTGDVHEMHKRAGLTRQ